MIQLIKVKDRDEGNLKARDLLTSLVDQKTLLALSGGISPDYRKMIVDSATPLRSSRQSFEGQSILPGAVCMVDERFGMPLHQNSNELILKSSGLTGYLEKQEIEFYRILKGKNLEETARNYNQIIEDLFKKFAKRVGVMGVGANLHTAGLFPNSEAAHSPYYVVYEVVDSVFPQRISLSLKALGEFQNFVILVFGQGKKEALKKLLDESENDMQKYPAIFYRKCFAKVYLITDINI